MGVISLDFCFVLLAFFFFSITDRQISELEYVRVIAGKCCGFVRYCYRACAEFAKLAMADG